MGGLSVPGETMTYVVCTVLNTCAGLWQTGNEDVCLFLFSQRKRHIVALKKRRAEKNKLEAAEYAKLLAQRKKEAAEKKQQEAKRRRSASMRESKTSVSSK